MSQTFTCARCSRTFEGNRPEEEAIAEMNQLFTKEELVAEGIAVLCDDCFNWFMGMMNRA